MPSNEGRVSDSDTDAAFHNPILGDDKMPSEVLMILRKQAKDAGLDPAVVKR